MCELEKGLVESYCDDIPDNILAILLSAMCKEVVWEVSTEEELEVLINIFDDIYNSFFYYYYDFKDNFLHQDEGIKPNVHISVEDFINKNYLSDYIQMNDLWQIKCDKQANKYILTFSLNDEDKLKQSLMSYFVRYEGNWLHSNNYNILSKDAYDKLLYSLMTECDFNVQQFHVIDTKYVKPIIYNVLTNQNLVLYDSTVKLNQNNEVIDFHCIVDGTYFVSEFNEQKDKTRIAEIEPQAITTVSQDKAVSKAIDSLTKEEMLIISIKDYLNKMSVERPTYQDIGDLMNPKLTANNIKQKVMNIKNKLIVHDLSAAVMLLKEYNRLEPFSIE